jgi:DNA-binding cell septation regulator SpoVG
MIEDIKIEIIDFYPVKQNKTTLGTVKVSLPDLNLSLLGIRVCRMKKGLFFALPMQRGYNFEAKKFVYYPLYVVNSIPNFNDVIVRYLQKNFDAFFAEWKKTHVIEDLIPPPFKKTFRKPGFKKPVLQQKDKPQVRTPYTPPPLKPKYNPKFT